MEARNKFAYKATSDTELNLEYAASLLLRVFQRYDVDNGGTLQRRELRHLLRHCGSNLSKKQCEGIIESLDQDGDGEMNFAEFMAFLGRLYQLQYFDTDPGEFWAATPQSAPPRGEIPARQGQPSSARQGHAPTPPPKPTRYEPPDARRVPFEPQEHQSAGETPRPTPRSRPHQGGYR